MYALPMTYDEWIAAAHQRYLNSKGGERMGQAYMNSLAEYRPSIANSINGTNADPFYSDEVSFDFLLAVSVLW